VTKEEREVRTAAYWKKALADVSPEHWEQVLQEDDLSVERANHDVLANEAMLEFLASPAAQLHKSRRYKHSPVSHRRVCQHQRCRKPFPAKRPTAKFCSKLCRQRKPLLPIIPCEYCGQPLQPMRSTARFHPECAQRAYRVEHANIDT
jgi:hypothetical protein